MHHFRMKSFSLIPCHKKDVSNFWCCCCYHFTDSSQQNLFIWSCSFSIGKRRSTSRSFLVNFSKFYWGIDDISWLIFQLFLGNYFLYWDFDCEFLFILSISFLQSNDSRYDCFWMSSAHSDGEPKLICIPKLQELDVIRMRWLVK